MITHKSLIHHIYNVVWTNGPAHIAAQCGYKNREIEPSKNSKFMVSLLPV
jgi:hypothetical protein